MKLCCGLLENLMLRASLERNASRADGRTVVILDSDEVLLPEDARFGQFSIVEASAEEREGLQEAGYGMPDWDPDRPPEVTLRSLSQPMD
jgi:hypothetical protein